MTSNTSSEKPDWFALIENDAPSAQVRKVNKKLPAATALAAIAIVASGAFFANASTGSSSNETNLAASTVASGDVATNISSISIQGSGANTGAKIASPRSSMGITDPSLNRGGDDDDDDDYDDDDYDDEDRD